MPWKDIPKILWKAYEDLDGRHVARDQIVMSSISGPMMIDFV